MKNNIITHSVLETIELGRHFGKNLTRNCVIAFFGDLAAGKTTFIKGLAAGVTGLSSFEVNSPTFTYLNIYKGQKSVYHFDLYRLSNFEEFIEMGFSDYFLGNICCIEWADRIQNLLPKDAIIIKITDEGKGTRRFIIENR